MMQIETVDAIEVILGHLRRAIARAEVENQRIGVHGNFALKPILTSLVSTRRDSEECGDVMSLAWHYYEGSQMDDDELEAWYAKENSPQTTEGKVNAALVLAVLLCLAIWYGVIRLWLLIWRMI